ncbi:uncharacterized protein LOC5518271 isoform X2 [Nematostella vectensis]|uniref:uncharacterized protein LOC5518271 isoform X2 n=1 Tax=Nematostella vectensis TaxID=45351 RepID=UPI0020776F56|nr:uncharacterized protein LOC5518271 isoform X2 [Nematostella vectensis]
MPLFVLLLEFLLVQVLEGRFPSPDEQPQAYRSMAHYWRFDSLYDYSDSISRTNATLHGNTSYISIKSSLKDNGHLSINGTASSVLLKGISTSCFHEPWTCFKGTTLAFWFKTFSYVTHSYIRSNNRRHFEVARIPSGKIIVRVINDTTAFEALLRQTPNSWSHITVDWSSQHGLKVYRNGLMEPSRVLPSHESRPARPRPTHSIRLQGTASYDDVMIWSRSLEEQEVKKVFQSQLNVMANISCEKTVTSLNISWQYSRDVYNMIRSYNLRLKQEGGSEALITKSLPKSARYYEFRDLLPFTSYRVKVWAKTERSYKKTSVVRCRTKEGVPERVERISVNFVSPRSLGLQWAPPVRINGILQGYTVNVSSTTPSFFRGLLVKNKQFVEVQNLRPNSTYTLVIAALTAAGAGPSETKVVSTAPISILTKGPSDLRVVAIGWNSIHVTWPTLPASAEVELYRIQACVPNSHCVIDSTNQTSLIVQGLAQLTEYRISIRGKNIHGFSPWTIGNKSIKTLDRDECTERVDNCSQFASCFNTHGGFMCTCLSGYVGNGVSCQRISSDTSASCPFEIARNITWPATYSEEQARQACPSGTSGTAVRMCTQKSGVAVWEPPDLENCVSVRFALLQEKLSKTIINANAAADLADALAQVTSPSRDEQIYGGDVKIAVSMLRALGHNTAIDPHNVTEEEKEKMRNVTSSLVEVASNLLDSGTLESWKEVPMESRSKQASLLLTSLESVALATASVLPTDGAVVKNTPNVLLNMQSFNKEHMSGKMAYPSDEDLNEKAGLISVPLDELQPPDSQQANSTQVSYLYYGNIGKLLSPSGRTSEKDEKSEHGVLSFSTRPKTSSTFDHPVVITLRNPMYHADLVPICVFWNDSSSPGFWSDEGCFVNGTNETHTICHCYHLTSFAVLMQHSPDTFAVTSQHQFALGLITYIGISISLLALSLALLTFSTFTFLKSSRNFAHINLTLSLILAEVIFLVGIDKTQYYIPCRVIAVLLHYLFLVVFCWMAAEGIILYIMLVRVFPSGTSGPRKKLFFCCSWGLPVVLVGFGAGFFWRGYGNERYCWLSVHDGYIWSFLAPVILISLVNIVFLSMTFKVMADRSNRQAAEKKKSFNHFLPPSAVRYWAKACAVLTCLLGTTWLLGLFFVNKDSLVMAYLFNIFNALQGLFIFIFHCVADERIRAEYVRILCCRGSRRDYNRKKSTGTFTLGKMGSASNGTLKDRKLLISSSEDKGGTLSRTGTLPRQTCEPESTQIPYPNTFDSDSLLTINKTSGEHGGSDERDDLKIIVFEPRDDNSLEHASDTEYDNIDNGKHADELIVEESLFNISSLEDFSSSNRNTRDSEDQSGLSLPRSKDYYSDVDYRRGPDSMQYDTENDADDFSDDGSHPQLLTDTGLLLNIGRCRFCSNSAYNMVCMHHENGSSMESEQKPPPSYVSTEDATTSSDLSHGYLHNAPQGRVSFDDAILTRHLRDDPSIPRVKKHRWTHTPMTGDSLALEITEYLSESASCDDRFLRSHASENRTESYIPEAVRELISPVDQESFMEPKDLELPVNEPDVEVYEPQQDIEIDADGLRAQILSPIMSVDYDSDASANGGHMRREDPQNEESPPDIAKDDKPLSPEAPIAEAESILLVAEVEPGAKFETCEPEYLKEDYQLVYIHVADDETRVEDLGNKYKCSLQVKIIAQSSLDQSSVEENTNDAAILLEEEPIQLDFDDFLPSESMSPAEPSGPYGSPFDITIESSPATKLRDIPDIIPDNYKTDRWSLKRTKRFQNTKSEARAERKWLKENIKQEQYQKTKKKFPDAQVMILGSESSLETISDRGSFVVDNGSLLGEREPLVYPRLEPEKEMGEGVSESDTALKDGHGPAPVRRGLVKRLGHIFESKQNPITSIRQVIKTANEYDAAELPTKSHAGAVRSLREKFEQSTTKYHE